MNDISELRAAVRIVMEAALSIIQADPHVWSSRPCSTCRVISEMVGRPFGCILYARQRKEVEG